MQSGTHFAKTGGFRLHGARLFHACWGAALNKQAGEENHGGIFFSAGLCVLTQALLAGIIPESE